MTSGTQLGPYTILELLGAGGMGEVWKARDTRLDRIVAIKRLKDEHGARFQQEARAVAALNHPHICQIYDVGPDYLVMEYVEGRPLRGPLAAKEVTELALQIAGALEEAHAAGILHRDLKPANILVTPKGAAKLLDFGLAKLLRDGDATQTFAISGTPLYMSPEQAEGNVLDARSDVFSFGAVLFELIAGQRPFDSLGAVLRDEPRALRTAPDLERLVLRCLRKAPEDRYQTVHEITTALKQCGNHPAEQQPSIAVLPFVNMSADKDNEYFSDGLAEEILNALAQVQGLKVIARTSSFAFRGKEQDITKIAEALRVRTVLEGSVRRSGNRIRVTAQLIEAHEGTHLWSERYDRQIEDLFAVQDEIAGAIAVALQVKLFPGRLGKAYKPSLPAYEALLKGRYHLQRNTPEAHRAAKVFLEQAVELDPRYARAHAELGVFYLVSGAWGLGSVAEAMTLAKQQAGKAFHIDPEEPQCNVVLGAVSALYDFDWKRGTEHFRRAMASESVPADTNARYAMFCLAPLGRLEEAKTEMEHAIEKDPLSFLWRSMLAMILSNLGRHEQAIAEARKALDINEHGWLAYLWMGIAYLCLGRLEDARQAAESGHRLAPWLSHGAGILAAVLRLSGEPVPQELLDTAGPGGMAVYHIFASEIDAAADNYEKAVEQHDIILLALNAGALFKPLRESSRWPAIAAMMKLPEAQKT
jgi:serine/threonine-protein kinase